MSAPEAGPLRLGVLVPCRNEAAVIGRKLANLALARWPASRPAPSPASGLPHRIAIVDDGSDDGTADLARAAAAARFAGRRDVEVVVVQSRERPGKPGAIRQGLAELEGVADLVVLTDADVVLEEDALVALERAFAADPRLALACGAQRFVADLADDGTCRSASLGAPREASEPFDRWTARARKLESRFGRLFSVHGQLLAWRAPLGLRPREGIAADDLDLMLQARARHLQPRRVALVPSAAFLEVKTPPGPARSEQALRRARAYVQLVRASSAPARDPLTRLQWAFYRRVPLAAPELTTILPLAAVLVAGARLGPGGALVALLVMLGVLASRPGLRWWRLASRIRVARRMEDRETLPERWEMARR